MALRSSLAALACWLSYQLAAQAGALDPAFGESGVTRFSYDDGDDLYGVNIALTSNGSIITTATMQGASAGRVLVNAFAPDGSPDDLFGESSAFSIVDAGVMLEVVDLVVTSLDAVIVCCNASTPVGESILLVKLLANGTPDITFGPAGRLWIAPPTGWGYRAGAVTLDADDRILIGGSAVATGGDTQAMLRRLHLNGAHDQTFGDDGMVLNGLGQLGPGWFREHISGLAVGSDGSIVAVGTAEVPVNPGWRAYKAKFTDAGVPLSYQGSYFGWGSGPSRALGVALSGTGDAIIIGNGDQANTQMAFGRYDGDGEEISSGMVLYTTHGALTSEGRAVAVDAEGRILLVGNATSTSGDHGIALARLLGNCEHDPDFGTAGRVFNVVGDEGWSEATDLVLQPDGRILVVGSSRTNGQTELTVARYLPSDGSGLPDAALRSALAVYPNPAVDHFTVSFVGTGAPVWIELLDLTGRTVVPAMQVATGPGPVLQAMQVPAGSAPGHYLVRLTSRDGVQTGRLVVR